EAEGPPLHDATASPLASGRPFACSEGAPSQGPRRLGLSPGNRGRCGIRPPAPQQCAPAGAEGQGPWSRRGPAEVLNRSVGRGQRKRLGRSPPSDRVDVGTTRSLCRCALWAEALTDQCGGNGARRKAQRRKVVAALEERDGADVRRAHRERPGALGEVTGGELPLRQRIGPVAVE